MCLNWLVSKHEFMFGLQSSDKLGKESCVLVLKGIFPHRRESLNCFGAIGKFSPILITKECQQINWFHICWKLGFVFRNSLAFSGRVFGMASRCDLFWEEYVGITLSTIRRKHKRRPNLQAMRRINSSTALYNYLS